MEKKDLLFIINAIISIIIIAAILSYVGLSDVLNALSSINLPMLALGMALLFGMDIIMSYRIKMLLDHLNSNVPFFHILRAHFVGMLAADFTPARSGYFATAGVLRYKYDVPSEKAMVAIFGPQIFDFTLKVLAGTVAILYLLYRFIGPGDGWILMLGSAVMLVTIIVMLLLLFSERFLKLFSFAERIPIISKICLLFSRMQDNSHAVVAKTPQLIILLLLSWAAKALSWFFIAKAVGITIDPGFPEVIFYFFLQPLVTMLEFMPSPTIAGLGLSEGGSTAIFALFGIPPATGTVFALVARFKTTLVHLPAVPEALATLRKNGP